MIVKRRDATGVLLFLLAAAVSTPAFGQPKVEVLPQAASPTPTVAAVGDAVTTVRPDTAVLTFAVEIRDPNTNQAVLANQRMTKKVVSEIEKGGIEATEISVDHYEMKHVVNSFIPALGTNQPVEFRVEQHGTYLVTSTIVVTIHNLADVTKVISTALGAGVDRIERVRYKASNLTEVEAGLMPQAITRARLSAESLAHDAGLRLGGPLRVEQLPDSSASTSIVAGNTVSGQTAPPRIEVRLRIRVVYAATKGSG